MQGEDAAEFQHSSASTIVQATDRLLVRSERLASDPAKFTKSTQMLASLYLQASNSVFHVRELSERLRVQVVHRIRMGNNLRF